MSIELKNISKKVKGNLHIKETSLSLGAGFFNVLLGETGAGKTSLIKLMAGLDSCATGQILMDGEDVTDMSPQKRNISLVHQFFVNYPHMTVFENIASPLRVSGMPRSEIEGRVEDAANLLQLRPMLQRFPHELSGGQQQRTALARAIAKESRAIFLDEPLANLDYKLREELREQLPELFSDRGTVVVYATSEPEEALLLGGKTGLMHDGHVTQFGRTADIYRSPVNLTSAEVFSDPPINKATVEKRGGDAFMAGGVQWKLPKRASGLADGFYIIGVRPNDVLPTKSKDANVKILGRITVTELSGSQSSAHFSFADLNWVSLAHGVHPFGIGNDHAFYMDASKCFFFSLEGQLVA
jgi:glycerol transport system ATP-binding protein